MMKKGNRANTLHGILLIALFSFAAFYIADIPVVRRLSFSPLIVGIILGMLYANSLRNRLPETWVPGIKFCTKQLLRWGIILYGFRLTLAQVAAVGVPAVVVDLVVVVVTILGGVALGRLMRIDRDTALMTSTGSAICGAAAVLGAEPVVRCEGYKTAIAVSTVVIFGTLSMFLYPIMYRTGLLDGLTDTGVAIYTGSTLHEVAHVAGAGNAMDPTDSLGIAATATITKMIRVMMLAPVLVVMSFVLARRRRETAVAGTSADAPAGKSRITIPWFAFGFIGVICLNSLLQYLLGVDTVKDIPLNGAIEYIDTFLLTMAMTALGTETTGLFTDDEKLAQDLLEAAKSADDAAWRLPMGGHYRELLKSNCADIVNTGNLPHSGACTAATFLKEFAPACAWAHLDIAGPANTSGADRQSTSRPMPLVFEWLLMRLAEKADKKAVAEA